jgi:Conjugative transfer region protein TrbK
MRSRFLFIALIIAGCGHTAPTDTAESLAADPNRLKEVMRQCRQDRAKANETLCNAASEAYRRRFMGDGKSQYTPSQ